MKKGTLSDMITKVELSAKIAQIALGCTSCNGPVRHAIMEYQNGLNQQNDNNSETNRQDGGRSPLEP